MPRADRAVILRLDSLRWDTIATPTPGHVADETPYVWTLFFRADGSTLRVTADAKVAGAAVVDSTPVSREDLGGHGISRGSSVAIPSAIGWWSAAVSRSRSIRASSRCSASGSHRVSKFTAHRSAAMTEPSSTPRPGTWKISNNVPVSR
jgi:hypothetical protein